MFRNILQWFDDALYVGGLTVVSALALMISSYLGWGLVQFLADLVGG
jgi:hypothetical protein